MTTEERAELGATYKASCNCCQAVLKAYSDILSYDENALSVLGAGFGTGMGCMEATCGALVGAGLVAGMRTEGKASVRFSKEILGRFKEKCGATICKDLKGIETGKVLCACNDCIRNAIRACDEVLGA